MKAELVETGTFKIDRKRTLKKLRDYQLPAGARGFLSWIRCAAASKAASIVITISKSSLRIEFDGNPFDKKELDDPYRALFSREGERGERNRHFALAMLWAWRAGVESVTILSGADQNRLKLHCESITQETLESAAPGLAETTSNTTIVNLEWSMMRLSMNPVGGLTRAFLAESCALVDSHVALNGEPLEPPADKAWPPYAFRKKELRGTLSIPDDDAKRKGVVALYVWGVYAADITLKSSDFPFKGRLNDNGFKLNASLTKVVQNERLAAGLKELQSRYPDFMRHIALQQLRASKEIGALLIENSRLRSEWKRVFDFDSTNDAPPGPATFPWHLPQSKRMRVHMAARMAAWIRMATETMTIGYSRAPKGELEKTLWRVPLIYDVRGRPVSLERLQREDKGPRIRFSTVRRSVYTRPDWIVWAMTRRDELWLQRVGKRTTINVTKIPERAW